MQPKNSKNFGIGKGNIPETPVWEQEQHIFMKKNSGWGGDESRKTPVREQETYRIRGDNS
jgi:hypothetical protein